MPNPQEDRPILNAIFDDLGAMRDEDRTFQKEVLDRLLLSKSASLHLKAQKAY